MGSVPALTQSAREVPLTELRQHPRNPRTITPARLAQLARTLEAERDMLQARGHSDYHYQHEDVLYGWKPGQGRPGRGNHAGTRWYGGNAQTSVFNVDRPSRSEDHPTMKPVALITAHLENSSRPGEAILDPFAGSGSTLIAAEQTVRRCYAMEIDPAYCDVIRDRYQAFTDGGL